MANKIIVGYSSTADLAELYIYILSMVP